MMHFGQEDLLTIFAISTNLTAISLFAKKSVCRFSKTCLKRPLKKGQNKTNCSLMKVDESILNTFDLHEAIIGFENQFLVFFLSDRLRQVLLYPE